jgi:hypothetical protein
VEGVVIVGSILLALALDAWWDGVQEREERESVLAALRADFSNTAAHLEQSHAMSVAALASSDTLLAILDGRAGSVEVPVATVVNAIRPPTPDPPLGALQALLSSGRLSLVGDDDLRAALAEWPSALADLQTKGELGESFVYARFLPLLSRQTDIASLIEGRMAQVMNTRTLGGPAPVDDRGTMTFPASDEVRGMLHERRLFATLLHGNNWLRAQDLLGRIMEGLEGSGR